MMWWVFEFAYKGPKSCVAFVKAAIVQTTNPWAADTCKTGSQCESRGKGSQDLRSEFGCMLACAHLIECAVFINGASNWPSKRICNDHFRKKIDICTVVTIRERTNEKRTYCGHHHRIHPAKILHKQLNHSRSTQPQHTHTHTHILGSRSHKIPSQWTCGLSAMVFQYCCV